MIRITDSTTGKVRSLVCEHHSPGGMTVELCGPCFERIIAQNQPPKELANMIDACSEMSAMLGQNPVNGFYMVNDGCVDNFRECLDRFRNENTPGATE
jgi:hypothetical protein